MASPFIFKQFQLNQSESAFKLGTDSVVLGCWLPLLPYKTILDIGSGTGILSLMMAQRFQNALVSSIEIDKASFNESTNNFTHSRFKDRIIAYNENAVDWSNKNIDEKFDLIVSNPPYFTDQLKNPDERKMNARHTNTLNSESMGNIILQNLSEEGYFACILPTNEFEKWNIKLNSMGIHPKEICLISSFEGSEVIRKIGLFSKKQSELIIEKQYLYNTDRSRSEWYKSISSEFYIK